MNLKFLETPGHTPEGITIVAEDTENADAPLKIFTGDTLFIGDVGRPDLIGSVGFTAEEMGGMLYDSLREKILKLPDETEVYPAHGAGSLCGKSLSKETWSTLGEQKKTNYALKEMSKEEFIKIVAADQPEAPQYFAASAAQNLKGSASLENLTKPEEFSSEEIENFDGIVLDVRQNTDFGAAHIPNAINIGLGGQFATWAGTLLTIGTPIAVAADTQEQIDEAVMRLARVGIETVKGFILMKDFDGQNEDGRADSGRTGERRDRRQKSAVRRCPKRGGTRERSRRRHDQSAAQHAFERDRSSESGASDLRFMSGRLPFEFGDEHSGKRRI